MTDNLDSDAETSDGDASEGESSGDSRIDEFLERIEDDPQPSAQDPTEPVPPESPDPTESVPPESLDPTESVPPESLDPTESVPPESPSPTESVPSESPDPQPNQRDADGSENRGRLWDSFSGGRSDDEDDDPPHPTMGDSASSPSEPPTESTPSEWATPDDSRESTPDPDPSGTDTDSSSTDTDPSNTDAENGESSFRTILKRISHRIGSVGSGSTDSDDTAASDTEPPTTGTPDPTPSDPRGPANAGRSVSNSTSSTRSDSIDEILNNIDLFGRATSSSQVLLLSPTAHSITNDIYSRFLLPTDGAGQNILFVSATQSASDQLGAARKIPQWREGKTAVIEVGQSTLKSRQPGGEDSTTQLDIYKQISNLKHLAKLGINISHIVSQWNGNRRPTVVGVHTLSAVQQYVGNETMFQFLFTLKGQLNSMGVMGFYHMDPAVHTDNEISTIQSAFDLVIRVSSDGSVDIE